MLMHNVTVQMVYQSVSLLSDVAVEVFVAGACGELVTSC